VLLLGGNWKEVVGKIIEWSGGTETTGPAARSIVVLYNATNSQ
jgi:hypothetical protein